MLGPMQRQECIGRSNAILPLRHREYIPCIRLWSDAQDLPAAAPQLFMGHVLLSLHLFLLKEKKKWNQVSPVATYSASSI
jgi:hypothetical protein